ALGAAAVEPGIGGLPPHRLPEGAGDPGVFAVEPLEQCFSHGTFSVLGRQATGLIARQGLGLGPRGGGRFRGPASVTRRATGPSPISSAKSGHGSPQRIPTFFQGGRAYASIPPSPATSRRVAKPGVPRTPSGRAIFPAGGADVSSGGSVSQDCRGAEERRK